MAGLSDQIGMTGILLIDIAIGVILSILTFSLLASAVQEAIAGLLNYRGAHLQQGIRRLLDDEDAAARLWEHPLIKGLKGPRNLIQRIAARLTGDADADSADRLPSSIPKASFARALIEGLVERRDTLLAARDHADGALEQALEAVDDQIDKLALDHRLKARLRALVREIDLGKDVLDDALEARIAEAETALAQWFDNAMDRVTGWYVRRAKTVLFLAGFALAMAVNFDLIGYAKCLSGDEALRRAVLEQAQGMAGPALPPPTASAPDTASNNASTASVAGAPGSGAPGSGASGSGAPGLHEIKTSLHDRATVLGWGGTCGEQTPHWFRMLLSWVLVGLGCTLGGQFWYDLLKGLLKVRAGASGDTTDSKPA